MTLKPNPFPYPLPQSWTLHLDLLIPLLNKSIAGPFDGHNFTLKTLCSVYEIFDWTCCLENYTICYCSVFNKFFHCFLTINLVSSPGIATPPTIFCFYSKSKILSCFRTPWLALFVLFERKEKFCKTIILKQQQTAVRIRIKIESFWIDFALRGPSHKYFYTKMKTSRLLQTCFHGKSCFPFFTIRLWTGYRVYHLSIIHSIWYFYVMVMGEE